MSNKTAETIVALGLGGALLTGCGKGEAPNELGKYTLTCRGDEQAESGALYEGHSNVEVGGLCTIEIQTMPNAICNVQIPQSKDNLTTSRPRKQSLVQPDSVSTFQLEMSGLKVTDRFVALICGEQNSEEPEEETSLPFDLREESNEKELTGYEVYGQYFQEDGDHSEVEDLAQVAQAVIDGVEDEIKNINRIFLTRNTEIVFNEFREVKKVRFLGGDKESPFEISFHLKDGKVQFSQFITYSKIIEDESGSNISRKSKGDLKDLRPDQISTSRETPKGNGHSPVRI